MHRCPTCGQSDCDNLNICPNCGIQLRQRCSACGEQVPNRETCCTKCGAGLEKDHVSSATSPAQYDAMQNLRTLMPAALSEQMNTVAAQMTGERREVSIVCVDVTKVSRIPYTLDTETTFIWIDETLRFLVDVIYKYEGTVDRFTGHGLVALFGVSLAHENDPERAVRAGLEMQTLLQPLRERVKHRYDFDIQLRIGITTGLVVAGKLAHAAQTEYTVIGNSVDLAAQLAKAAEPGTALVSFETYQRTLPLFVYQVAPSITVAEAAPPSRASVR